MSEPDTLGAPPTRARPEPHPPGGRLRPSLNGSSWAHFDVFSPGAPGRRLPGASRRSGRPGGRPGPIPGVHPRPGPPPSGGPGRGRAGEESGLFSPQIFAGPAGAASPSACLVVGGIQPPLAGVASRPIRQGAGSRSALRAGPGATRAGARAAPATWRGGAAPRRLPLPWRMGRDALGRSAALVTRGNAVVDERRHGHERPHTSPWVTTQLPALADEHLYRSTRCLRPAFLERVLEVCNQHRELCLQAASGWPAATSSASQL